MVVDLVEQLRVPAVIDADALNALAEQRKVLPRLKGPLVFTPHLTPMIRGIHATLYARLTKTDVDLQQVYETRYATEPFVDVMPPGSHPDTRSVRASNVCRIAVHRPREGDIAVILAVIDNLVKGAAGQAVQNMNLMFGLPEETGLSAPPVLP